MEASYQLAVTEEDLEKCLNYCRSLQLMMETCLVTLGIENIFP